MTELENNITTARLNFDRLLRAGNQSQSNDATISALHHEFFKIDMAIAKEFHKTGAYPDLHQFYLDSIVNYHGEIVDTLNTLLHRNVDFEQGRKFIINSGESKGSPEAYRLANELVAETDDLNNVAGEWLERYDHLVAMTSQISDLKADYVSQIHHEKAMANLIALDPHNPRQYEGRIEDYLTETLSGYANLINLYCEYAMMTMGILFHEKSQIAPQIAVKRYLPIVERSVNGAKAFYEVTMEHYTSFSNVPTITIANQNNADKPKPPRP